jgi:hypothetical protein
VERTPGELAQGLQVAVAVPPYARSLQHRWDAVITARAISQAVAAATLCAALAIP